MIDAWREPRLRPVVTASLTLGLTVGVFGFVFGVSAVTRGASVWQACAMSLLVFTGASQFTAVSVVGDGGSTASALGGALLLAARNGAYGLAMARRIRGSLGRRLLAAQLVIDESTAMAAAQSDPEAGRAAFWITGITIYVCWNTATLLGAFAGTAIDPASYGLDVAIPAAFVAMLWPLLSESRARIAAVGGAVICVVLTPLLPVGVPILCAAAAVLVGVRR
jgi:4-azaleucine resistance transporter AzlC